MVDKLALKKYTLHMKKKFLIILFTMLSLTVITFIGRYYLLPTTASDFFMHPIMFKAISAITTYCFVAAVFLIIPLLIFARKAFVLEAPYKSKKVKSVMSDLSMGLMLFIIIPFLLIALYHCDRSGFVRHEALKKHEAMSVLYENMQDADDVLYFSEAIPFEWDTIYIFTHELSRNDLEQYVDKKTSTKFSKAFNLLGKIHEEEGKSVFCIFNDGKLLITYDLGVHIYESPTSQDIICFKELSPKDAVFQVEKYEDDFYTYNLYLIGDAN